MANIRLIRGRIRSAKSISQITKAMELVSASKMKKAQAQAQSGKLYAQKIYEMVTQLARRVDISSHALLVKPKVITGRKLVILITTNKGLCGGLNTNLFRFMLHEFPLLKQQDYITLGKKGTSFVTATRGTLKADFSEKTPFIGAVPSLTELATEYFLKGRVDEVVLVYNEFVSALKQLPRVKTILPLSIEGDGHVSDERGEDLEFLIEPGVRAVFDSLLPHYLENQIRDAILQAEASEHSARMVAMRNATENAKSFIQELTLLYNKARQEKITYELADIVTARIGVQ